MSRLLAMALAPALLLSGCAQEDATEPKGQGAWLTLGRSGLAVVFARYPNGETEKLSAPFSTEFNKDGKSLVITLHSQACGAMLFEARMGSDELTRVNTSESVARALPCRLNTAETPKWQLLTKIVNSKEG